MTTIAAKTMVQGRVSGQGDLTVHGRVRGSIVLDGVLYLEPEGIIEAQASVARALISGVFVGDLYATERIDVAETARIVGNLYTPTLRISGGAQLRGRADTVNPIPNEHTRTASAKSSKPTKGSAKNDAAIKAAPRVEVEAPKQVEAPRVEAPRVAEAPKYVEAPKVEAPRTLRTEAPRPAPRVEPPKPAHRPEPPRQVEATKPAPRVEPAARIEPAPRVEPSKPEIVVEPVARAIETGARAAEAAVRIHEAPIRPPEAPKTEPMRPLVRPDNRFGAPRSEPSRPASRYEPPRPNPRPEAPRAETRPEPPKPVPVPRPEPPKVEAPRVVEAPKTESLDKLGASPFGKAQNEAKELSKPEPAWASAPRPEPQENRGFQHASRDEDSAPKPPSPPRGKRVTLKRR